MQIQGELNGRRLLYLLLPTLGVLSLIDARLDLGRSLSQLLAYYQQIRDFFFSPFEAFGMRIPGVLKDQFVFWGTVIPAFLRSGGILNRAVAVAFLGAVATVPVGAVLMYPFTLISDHLESPGEGGGLLGLIEAILVMLLGWAVVFCLLPVFIWWLIALFPPITGAAGLVRWKPLRYVSGIYAGILSAHMALVFRVHEKFFPHSRIELEPSEVIARFGTLWTADEYKAYYKPLVEVAAMAFVAILIGKVVIDTFLG